MTKKIIYLKKHVAKLIAKEWGKDGKIIIPVIVFNPAEYNNQQWTDFLAKASDKKYCALEVYFGDDVHRYALLAFVKYANSYYFLLLKAAKTIKEFRAEYGLDEEDQDYDSMARIKRRYKNPKKKKKTTTNTSPLPIATSNQTDLF